MCVRVHKMSSELTQNPTDILNLNSQDKTMPTLFKQKHQKKKNGRRINSWKKIFFFLHSPSVSDKIYLRDLYHSTTHCICILFPYQIKTDYADIICIYAHEYAFQYVFMSLAYDKYRFRMMNGIIFFAFSLSILLRNKSFRLDMSVCQWLYDLTDLNVFKSHFQGCSLFDLTYFIHM